MCYLSCCASNISTGPDCRPQSLWSAATCPGRCLAVLIGFEDGTLDGLVVFVACSPELLDGHLPKIGRVSENPGRHLVATDGPLHSRAGLVGPPAPDDCDVFPALLSVHAVPGPEMRLQVLTLARTELTVAHRTLKWPLVDHQLMVRQVGEVLGALVAEVAWLEV